MNTAAQIIKDCIQRITVLWTEYIAFLFVAVADLLDRLI